MKQLRKAFVRIYDTIPVMLKWPSLKNRSLQSRFLIRVLLPPFIILLLLGGAAFWLYNQSVREQAYGGLEGAASSTAIRLEREIAIRKTVLTTSGSELLQLKKQIKTKHDTLATQRDKCRRHIRRTFEYEEQADGVCAPFVDELAALPLDSPLLLKAVENSYLSQAEELNEDEAAAISQRLDAFAEFFPETLVLLIVDGAGRKISEAVADIDGLNVDKEGLLGLARLALDSPVESELTETGDFRQALFAYPIEGGAVMAAYHLDHAGFVDPIIESVSANPAASGSMLVAGGNVVYPNFSGHPTIDLSGISTSGFEYQDSGLVYSAVASPVSGTDWYVVAGSPRTLVLAPVRDARLTTFLLAGGALVIFLWLGTMYIQHQVRSIRKLVSGALVFSSNRLDFKIDLGEADREYVQLADTMNEMAARIAEAEAEMDRRNQEFISIATHELKAPMTGIIGSLSMVLEDKNGKKPDTKNKKMIDIAYSETIKLRDLVNDLLDVAMIEGGRVELEEEPVDICRLVEDVIGTLKMPADENGIKLIHPCKGEVPGVMADSTKLQVVVTNLVSNAIKYNRSGGKIEINHKSHDDMLVTSVSDNGLGIPADQQKHIFEKFFRVDSREHRQIKGTGLGMYAAKKYVEAMGGEIWFESEPGKGTTFSFSLPVSNQDLV